MSPVKKPKLLSYLSHKLITQSAGRVLWEAISILVVICGLCAAEVHAAETQLVSAGSTWKYLDNGSNQGTAWRAGSFNDSGWASGAAQLGYGDGDEATLLSYGPNASNKFITTYFRRAFSVADASVFASLILRVLRDDGAVVYLNGTEVWRTNMPGGAVSHTTRASVAIGGTDETTYLQTSISPALLVNGTNVLAVEIHQVNVTSSDISFDLQLIGSDTAATPLITRGPYLQSGTPVSIIVRWRTDQVTDSRVRYGTSPGNLTSNADIPTLSTDHEVTVSGLSVDTTYYYSIGTTTATLAGGDANHFFVTSPATGTQKPTRIWVLGDSGTATSSAQAVRDAYLNFAGTTHTNLVLMLGDNAYQNGTDGEYQAAVFNMYPSILRKSVLWPTLGNHDTAQSTNPPVDLPYYQIFTLPSNAEAGGIASGTEDYYSFDYGNIHFICLDSMTSSRSPSGAMLTWLQSDLASTLQPWIVAFWHHPPYTKASHNSDTDAQLIEIRQNVLPILEAGGVDLVLTGHSHSYERSFLIDGHYGSSSTFNDSMKKDGGDGREGGNGAYTKPSAGSNAHEGAVYAVAGGSGQISGGALNHPAMFISLNSLGSMVLDFDSNRLEAKFLNSVGAVADHFSIIKGSPTAVDVASFTCDAYDSGVYLRWQTGMEAGNLGFHLYREQGGQRTRITPELVAGSALLAGNKTRLAAGNAYGWWDKGFADCGSRIADCQNLQYWLEDIDLDGNNTMHGPFRPKPVAGLPPEPSTAALLSRIGNGEPTLSQVSSNRPASTGPSLKQTEKQWTLAGRPAVKLTIKGEGWYRVTQQELMAAGLDPKKDPRNLQLYLEGEEQAMLVVGEHDGKLDPGDAIEFYGSGKDVPSTDARVYWLASGKQPGKRISIARSEGKPGEVSSFSYTVERKARTIYFSSLKNGDAENFFGRVITSQPVEMEMMLRHLDQGSQADGVLEVGLQGVTNLSGLGPDHQVRVTLNGTVVGRMIFDGRQHPVETFAVLGGLLKEGENIVGLVAEGGPSDVSLVDFIRITYRHAYTADHDALRMTVGETRQSSGINLTIDGFSNRLIRVFDVTNPSEPQELIGDIEERKGGGFTVSLQVSDGGLRTLIAHTADQIKRPASITGNSPSNWRDKGHKGDLLIITHRTFAGSLAPLAALRRKQGFAVETVDIEDIYDEFSFGEKSPDAVKSFLAFARASWKLAPRFVLFAGDASFDPRNYLGAGDFDLLPSKLIDTAHLETASDDWFVDFNDDGLAEMYVGRLPVRTPAEATALVSKIVNHDSVNAGAPSGRRSVLLVADKSDGFDFEEASKQLRALVPTNTGVQEIFRGRLDDATAKKHLLEAINAGQSIVNYTGHGSTNVWRSLLTTDDARSLTNQQSLPLFMTMTCLNGFFQDPVMESLAEGLLKSDRGGAIAVWASSGLTAPSQQAVMNQQAYRLLFARTIAPTIGEALSKAKSSVSDNDIRRTWILFGDPTMRLK